LRKLQNNSPSNSADAGGSGGGLGVASTMAPAYAAAKAGFFVMEKFGAGTDAIRIRRRLLQRLPNHVCRLGGMHSDAAQFRTAP
jgi:hypothetical protein